MSNEEKKVKAEVQFIIIGSSRKLKDSNLNSVNQYFKAGEYFHRLNFVKILQYEKIQYRSPVPMNAGHRIESQKPAATRRT